MNFEPFPVSTPGLVVSGRRLLKPCDNCGEAFETFFPLQRYCKKPACQEALRIRLERKRRESDQRRAKRKRLARAAERTR